MTAFHNTPMRLFGIATALALILAAAAIVWWLSTGELGAQGTADDGNDAEVLAAALAVTTHSSALVSANSAATNLSMNRESLRQSATSFAGHRTALAEQLEILDGKGYDDRVGRIEILGTGWYPTRSSFYGRGFRCCRLWSKVVRTSEKC